jgi:hypothetical protein
MKWDIDKALKALEDSDVCGTAITRVVLSSVELLEHKLGRLTAEERSNGYAPLWCLGLGRSDQRKVFIYGRTIRAAHLRARKVVKAMTPEERAFFGVKVPRTTGARRR